MNSRRRNKLPMASFQLRLALPFLVATFGALLCHVVVLSRGVAAATEAAGADAVFADAVVDAYYTSTLWTLALVGPILVLVAVLMTFRIAGPLFHMRQHLERVADGDDPGSCELRKTDDLHGFCDSMNRALARARVEVLADQAAALQEAAEDAAQAVASEDRSEDCSEDGSEDPAPAARPSDVASDADRAQR